MNAWQNEIQIYINACQNEYEKKNLKLSTKSL